MADVYLAQDTELGHQVALKLIEHSPDVDTRDAIEAERRGAELQARLADIDPRVVRVYDCGDTGRLLLRRHGIHRRAGPGRADAPRPAGRRVRRRCRHGRGRDAGERPHPARRTSTARSSAASSTATSSPRTSASMRAAKCACWISASPRRFRFRAGSRATNSAACRTPRPNGSKPGDVNVLSDLWSLAVMLYEMVTGTAAVSGRFHRAAGAHDPLAHSAAARARPVPRAAAPHPDQGHGAGSGSALPDRRANSPTT